MQGMRCIRPGKRQYDTYRCHILGCHTGNGNPGHIHAHHQHKKQVQNDIEHTGAGQEHQRFSRIPCGTEHSVAKIIYSQRRHTEKIDAQIQKRPIHQLFLRPQQPQDRAASQLSHSQNRNSHDQAQKQRRMYGTADILLLSFSHGLGSDDIDSAAHTDEETGKQCHKCSGGTHRSQRAGACKTPHHCQV